jgi:hypothetical protein
MELSYVNREFLRQSIIIHNVIDSRRSQLEDIKQELRKTGILDFIAKRTYLWDAAFRTVKSLSYSAKNVLDHITFEGDEQERMKEVFEMFLLELQTGSESVFCNK